MSVQLNQVYDWLDGRRMKVTAMPLAANSFYQLTSTGGQVALCYGHEIVALGTLTKIQPGQIWSHQYMSTLIIEIIDACPGEDWLCREVDYKGQVPTKLGEDYLLANYVLTSPIFAEPTHGTQTCPRCGSAGACVLMHLVACMNKKCPCYTTNSVLVA